MSTYHIFSKLFLLFSLLSIIPIFFALKIRPKDEEAYKKLMKEDLQIHSKSAIEEIPIDWIRKNVQKKLWIYRKQNESLQEIEMKAKQSHLSLLEKKGKIEVVEWANEILAKDEEKTYKPSSSNSDLFLNASSYYLDANTYSLEGDLELFFRVDDKPSIALCDAAFFDPDKKKLILESLPEKKVLFSQEGKEISAKRIEISDKVEAIGNVHLYFDAKEKERIQCLFSK